MGCRRYQQHDLNALQWMDLKIPNLSISNSTPFYQIHTIDDDSALKINIDFFESTRETFLVNIIPEYILHIVCPTLWSFTTLHS